MAEHIGHFSPEDVIEAIEQNLIDSSVSLGRTEEGVVFRGKDVTWVYTGYKALSRVLRARFSPDEAEDKVAEITECFRQWDAPVLWVVGPSTWPPQLGEYLHGSGFGNSEGWTGMAVDLKKLGVPADPVPKLDIQLVTETDDLQSWSSLCDEQWAGEAAGEVHHIFSPENAGGDPRCRYYLGRVDGTAVVRGMTYSQGEVAGLYWVGTGDAGIDRDDLEAAMVAHALTDAAGSGATLGVMPVRGNHTIFRAMGFAPYCQFSVYAWPPSPLRMPVC